MRIGLIIEVSADISNLIKVVDFDHFFLSLHITNPPSPNYHLPNVKFICKADPKICMAD